MFHTCFLFHCLLLSMIWLLNKNIILWLCATISTTITTINITTTTNADTTTATPITVDILTTTTATPTYKCY